MVKGVSILPLKSQNAGIQLLVTLMVFLAVVVVFFPIIILSGRLIFGPTIAEFSFDLVEPGKQQLAWLKYSQSLQHLSMFTVTSLMTGWLMTADPLGWFGLNRPGSLSVFIYTTIIALAIIPLSMELAGINRGLDLPEGLEGVERWLRLKEDRASQLTGWLLSEGGRSGLWVNLLVAAVIPAVGEELMFRGLIQRIFARGLGSNHMAIIATAIIFSAIHLQFYGFLPRLMLGLVYGYLFWWSGSVLLPMLAHLINNSIPVVLAYIYGWNTISGESVDFVKGNGSLILGPVVIAALFLYLVRERCLRSSSWESHPR